MKVYIFEKNKKITNYFTINALIYFVTFAALPFLIMNLLPSESIDEFDIIIPVTIGLIAFYITPIILIYISIIMYHSKAKYKVANSKLTSGILFKKTIDCRDIITIRCKKDFLNFVTHKKTITMKLSMLKSNPEYAKSIFNFVKDNIAENVKIDDKSHKLLNGETINLSYEKTNLSIKGWLLAILVCIVYSVFTPLAWIINDITLFFNFEYNLFYIIDMVFSLLILFFTIVVIVMFIMKKRKTARLIQVWLWVSAASYVMKLYSLNSIYDNNNIVVMLLLYMLVAIGYVTMTLGIIEYLKTSVRVKNTFVN